MLERESNCGSCPQNNSYPLGRCSVADNFNLISSLQVSVTVREAEALKTKETVTHAFPRIHQLTNFWSAQVPPNCEQTPLLTTMEARIRQENTETVTAMNKELEPLGKRLLLD